MALLFAKNLIFRSSESDLSTGPRYRRISQGRTSDVEAAGSSASSVSNDDEYDEKRRFLDSALAPAWRLDPRILSDATIGLSDGLTVPFALTAGLSALGDTRVVIYGGLAELIAGAISMGLGGYLGARAEAESYSTTAAETAALVRSSPFETASMIRDTLSPYDVPPGLLSGFVHHLSSHPTTATAFLLRFHHDLPETAAESRAYMSAMTISMGYFVGGFIPLLPYLFMNTVQQALMVSAVVMALALFAFGFVKTRLVGVRALGKCMRGGAEMMVLGGCAAAASMTLVKALG